jgi:hypothetical protein
LLYNSPWIARAAGSGSRAAVYWPPTDTELLVQQLSDLGCHSVDIPAVSAEYTSAAGTVQSASKQALVRRIVVNCPRMTRALIHIIQNLGIFGETAAGQVISAL